jgi:hypothetical protein
MSPSITSTEFFQGAGLLVLIAAAIWLALWAALAARGRARTRRGSEGPGSGRR